MNDYNWNTDKEIALLESVKNDLKSCVDIIEEGYDLTEDVDFAAKVVVETCKETIEKLNPYLEERIVTNFSIILKVSDEGHQSDNFIGFFVVFATTPEQAIKMLKENWNERRFGSFEKNKVTVATMQDIKDTIWEKQWALEIWSDCYN